MKIAYGKIGRSITLDPTKWSVAGGDADVVRLLWDLAIRNPEHEFIFLSRNSGEPLQQFGFPENVVNPWTKWRPIVRREMKARGDSDTIAILTELMEDYVDDVDGVVAWLGQHGTSNMPIPKIGTRLEEGVLTSPQVTFINYCSYFLRFINDWRDIDPENREEVWLCPDPRNYFKLRDLKWPLRQPILAQYAYDRTTKFERYANEQPSPPWDGIVKEVELDHVWIAPTSYEYAAVEMTALPHPAQISVNEQPGEHPFGMIVNENRKDVVHDRLTIVQQWVLSKYPDAPLHGIWSDDSKEQLGRDIQPLPNHLMWDTLRTFRSTLTTPASGSGWATAKPWESFAAGVVCFFHPSYDTQGHIMPFPDRSTGDEELDHLAAWLRPPSAEAFHKAVQAVADDDDVWRWLVSAQRRYFERAYADKKVVQIIEKRTGLLPSA